MKTLREDIAGASDMALLSMMQKSQRQRLNQPCGDPFPHCENLPEALRKGPSCPQKDAPCGRQHSDGSPAGYPADLRRSRQTTGDAMNRQWRALAALEDGWTL